MSVTYLEDGSIEIDNSELLNGRADIDTDDAFEGDRGGLGGIKEESALKRDKRNEKWNEPTHKATDVLHVCPVCNTRYYGRPNKAYCSTGCREVAKKRRQRQHKRDMRDFKPYRGKTGEVYFMCNDEKTIGFIPAINAESRAKAKKYLEETYPTNNDYYEQIKKVIQ